MTPRSLWSKALMGAFPVAAIAGAALLATGAGSAGAASHALKRGGTITVLSAGDVDHIDPGEAYYSFAYEIDVCDAATVARVQARQCQRSARPGGAHADRLQRRPDDHRAHPQGRALQPAGEPRGHHCRRQVRDRAWLRHERRERLRPGVLRRSRRRPEGPAQPRTEHQRHPDAELNDDRLQASPSVGCVRRRARAPGDRTRSGRLRQAVRFEDAVRLRAASGRDRPVHDQEQRVRKHQRDRLPAEQADRSRSQPELEREDELASRVRERDPLQGRASRIRPC